MEKLCKCYYCDYVEMISPLDSLLSPPHDTMIICCNSHGNNITVRTFYSGTDNVPWAIGLYRKGEIFGLRMHMYPIEKNGFLFLDSGEPLEVKYDPDNAINKFKTYLLLQ